MLTPTKTMSKIGTTVLCDAAIICFAQTGIEAGTSGFPQTVAGRMSFPIENARNLFYRKATF
jgi:hypothetical protein